MANPVNLANGDVLPEAWVDAVWAQIVRIYASTAARDADIATPFAGQCCYVASNDANEGFYTYSSAGSWRKRSWNDPWGKDGMPYLTKTASQTTATAADITSMSTTWTPVARRKYEIMAHVPRAQILTSNGEAGITIAVGASIIQGAYLADSANNICPCTMVCEYDASSTTPVTLKMSMGVVTAGGIGVTGSSTTPIVLSVKDIGPSGAPS